MVKILSFEGGGLGDSNTRDKDEPQLHSPHGRRCTNSGDGIFIGHRGEYSVRSRYPYGKMWYYEQILRIPIYVIFYPADGMLEVRKLNSSGRYEIETLDEEGRYFIPGMDLYLGVWYGKRYQTTIHWLRWWDSKGNMLLWGSEIIALQQQRLEAEAAKLAVALSPVSTNPKPNLV